MDFFKVTVTGLETIDTDFNEEMKKINSGVASALNLVASEMTDALKKHIKEDWYDPWGPPKEYIRRTDNPSYGRPLGGDKNITLEKDATSLTFIYSPSGEHQIGKWNTHSGDSIIDILQENKGWSFEPSKDKKGRSIMARPFWDNFVSEMKDGGILDAFVRGMAKKNQIVLPEGGDADLLWDMSDGELER